MENGPVKMGSSSGGPPGEEFRDQRLFEEMLNGIAHCKMLFEEGRPVDFIYLDVNEAFERQTGLREVVGKRVSEVIPGICEKDPELFKIYGRVVQSGVPERFEMFVHALDAWFDVSVYSPALEEFVAIFEVVTKRKAAENTLKDALATADRYFETVGILLVVLDRTGHIVRLNRSGYQLLGYEEGSLTGQDWFDVCLPPEARPEVKQMYQRVITGQTPMVEVYENPIITREGFSRLMLWHNKFMTAEDGSVIGALASGEDITERKKAESQLCESLDALRRLTVRDEIILSNMNEGLVVFSPEGEVLLVNQSARKRWLEAGIPVPRSRSGLVESIEWIKSGQKEILLSEGPSARVMRGERFSNFEVTVKFKGAETPYHGSYSGVPVFDDDGRMLYGIMTDRDISERYRYEHERMALEQQLNHLQRMESIGRLAGGIAHDINNVLGAIMAVASQQQRNQPPMKRQADLILQACLRGRDLIKGLMDFARKEAQDTQLVDLNALVAKEADLLANTTLQRIKIVVNLQPSLPPVMASPTELANVLMNLCVNAVDAMPEKGTLTFTTSWLEDRTVELVVKDTGQGMTPEVLAHAIEPFYTTKPFGKGTGLGLAVAYGTIRAHGGDMNIHSQPGVGTQVHIRLPMASLPAELSSETAKDLNPGPRRAHRILLVDDDPLVRQSAMCLLESLDHQVVAVVGGKEAIEVVERDHSFSAVILDQNMPGMNGIETLRAMRALGVRSPVIIATGYADESLKLAIRDLDRVWMLTKPFTLEEMEETLAGIHPGYCS